MLSYEEILERALMVAMEGLDLEMAAESAGDEPLTDDDNEPVEVREIQTLADAGFMTRDNGVVIRLTDGREYTLTLNQYR
ncbi:MULTISPECIES: hypothetical protein [Micromonospora]|uniref:Halobacterial output domain-containing protein n=1 Tax=Micromonospora solifontis TaxID=2487138 RepID=A0ABX9WA59_9ACTN|nr:MULTISPECIES: hypothetical protein [Micromonospora]NES14540.1 hypothetical protein [Micromonospora sp. PPF5-17B]NES39062.1 hypothetical protein [Micromonospora solifontis]RNL91376.1 hypothetical protein EFE23_23440 [Micromonospora solifontis]